MEIVRKAEGIKINGIGKRKVNRREALCQETKGGKRLMKNEQTKTWLNPGAIFKES